MEGRSASGSLLGKGLLVVAALFMLWASFVALRDQHGALQADDWRILADLHANGLIDWIFTHQNGHRVPFTLALFALDYEFFGAQSHLLVSATLVSAWVSAGVLTWVVWSDRPASTPLASADEAPRFVVLTNARDVIVGLASMAPHGETSAGQAAWSGYGIDLRARRPWGILADGRTACRLETPRADAGSDP